MKYKSRVGFIADRTVWLALLSALLLATLTNAQSFLESNRQTTQLFNKKDWPALIQEGNAALDSGLDYLGLRYRLGVAHYELRDYFKSTEHFEQALQYDHGNPYVQEYLYYSYLFSGREKDARQLAGSFRPDLLEKTGHKKFEWLDFVYLEGGAKQSSQSDSIGTMPFFSLGLRHRLGYRLDLYQSLNFLQQQYLQTDFRQLEYYLRADWQIGPGLTLHPALHYIDLEGDIDFFVENPLAQQVLGGYLGLTIARNRWRIQPYYALIRSDTEVDYTQLDLPFIYQSAVNSSQLGLNLVFTPPVWDDRLWLQAGTALHESEGAYSAIWRAGLSLYLNEQLALHGNYFSSGGSLQFVENQAAILNNSIGAMDGRWAANVEYKFGQNIHMLLGYQQEAKTTTNFSFNYNTLFLGLKLFL